MDLRCSEIRSICVWRTDAWLHSALGIFLVTNFDEMVSLAMAECGARLRWLEESCECNFCGRFLSPAFRGIDVLTEFCADDELCGFGRLEARASVGRLLSIALRALVARLRAGLPERDFGGFGDD